MGECKFGDPKIAVTDNSSDGEPLLVWLNKPALLNIVPTANPLS